MKAQRFWKFAAVGMTVACVLGCGSGGDSGSATTTTGTASTGAAGTTAKSDAKPLELAFVTNNSSDYWKIARKGTEKGQSEVPNVKVDFEIPADGQVAQQRQLIDGMLAKGVDGIAMSPIKPENEADEINKAAGKVLLFTQDSDAPTTNRACYIGTDNVAAGRQVGEQLKKSLPNGGKIMCFVGQTDVQNAKDRLEGLRDAIKDTKIQIIDVRTDETDRVKAKSNVSDALVKYPDLVGLVGLWSYNGPQILSAVKDADKQGKVKIVCFDGDDATLQGVKDGFIDGTVVQQPFVFGEMSIKVMAQVLRGDKSAIPANKIIFIPSKIIDKAGIDAYEAEQNKLLGKS